MMVTNYTRKTFAALAKTGILTIKFDKVGGGQRTMNCTLLPEYLDTLTVEPPKRYNRPWKQTNDVPMSVVDLAIGEWRSFIPDTVYDAEWEAADLKDIQTKFPKTKKFKFELTIETTDKSTAGYITMILQNLISPKFTVDSIKQIV